jgi:hypothetical protein
MVRAALQAILRFEMAAHPRGAGDRMDRQKLARLVQGVEVGQRWMQAIKAAEVQQPTWNQFAAQFSECRIAVRHHSRHTVEGSAQDHHDKTPLGRGCGQRERNASESECRGEAEQGGTAGKLHHHRLWNSGAESRSVMASRREPARCTACSVFALSNGPRAASASSAASRPFCGEVTRPDTP